MVPMISIHSQRGIIGIESEPGRFEIKTRKPDVRVDTTPTQITANNRPGELRIDHTLTSNALDGGKPEAYWLRIYSQYKAIAQQNIEKIVMEGNRMGDLRVKGNPIADMAWDAFMEGPPDLQVYGPASPMNLKFEYIPNDVNIQVDVGKTEIDVQVHRPDIHYERGYVRTFMQQWPSVTITPPSQLDLMA